MEKFSVWVLSELNRRGWRPVDLANKARISEGAVSNILNGNRKPGPDLCRAIAHALNVPEEEVFRQAGLLSPKPKLSSQAEELKAMIDLLKEEHIAYVAEVTQWRLDKQSSEDQPEDERILNALERMTPDERENVIRYVQNRPPDKGHKAGSQ